MTLESNDLMNMLINKLSRILFDSYIAFKILRLNKHFKKSFIQILKNYIKVRNNWFWSNATINVTLLFQIVIKIF